MPPPTNFSELHSFLGMTNYLSRFALKLTKKNIPWLWTYKHQNVIHDLKTELISPKVISYYDPSLNALIFRDS